MKIKSILLFALAAILVTSCKDEDPPQPVQPACNASFSMEIDSTSGMVEFSATSINAANTYFWDFGDGSFASEPVSSHSYSTPGVYYTCLTVSRFDDVGNLICSDVKCDSITILNPPPASNVLVDISNVIGSVNVDETGATYYPTSGGESFSVTKLKYYLTNFQLLRNGSVTYTMPSSYFLVDESDQTTTKLTLPNVPAGEYDAIRFLIGVDSLRNVSGAQTGALDPANGMFWTWSTGYIFYKLEGKSPNSTLVDSSFNFHIAGFRESNNTNAIREVIIGFNGDVLNVIPGASPELHLIADHQRFFNGPPNQMIINGNENVMTPGARSLQYADNYSGMFTFDHIHPN